MQKKEIKQIVQKAKVGTNKEAKVETDKEIFKRKKFMYKKVVQ